MRTQEFMSLIDDDHPSFIKLTEVRVILNNESRDTVEVNVDGIIKKFQTVLPHKSFKSETT